MVALNNQLGLVALYSLSSIYRQSLVLEIVASRLHSQPHSIYETPNPRPNSRDRDKYLGGDRLPRDCVPMQNPTNVEPVLWKMLK